MKRIVIVLLVLGGITLPESSFAQKSPDCGDQIKVSTITTHTIDGPSGGKIEFKFEDESAAKNLKFYITPIGEKTEEGTKDGFRNLKAGFYDVYIVDKKGCLKQVQVQVK
jgi:hypothetical protein